VTSQQRDVAAVLLDALTALDPDDQAASVRAVPLALARLDSLVGEGEDQVNPIAYGAMTLANLCITLVAAVKDVDRLDVIAALRPLLTDDATDHAA
jgi:hypothetical protein